LALCDGALSFYRKSRGHDLIEIDKKKDIVEKILRCGVLACASPARPGLALYYPGKPSNSSLLLKIQTPGGGVV
jgi:hypothetical protein